MIAALLLLGLGAWGPHPESLSRSFLTVDEGGVDWNCHFQSLSLIEVYPDLDLNEDIWLSASELEAGRERIGDYLAGRYRVFPGGSRAEPGRALFAELVQLEADDTAPANPFELQWVRARLRLTRAPESASQAAIRSLTIESRLFAESNPWHRDFTTVHWGADDEERAMLSSDDPAWTSEPASRRRFGVLGSFWKLGLEHILGGWDHLAFILALLVASRSLRTLVGVVTAFTLAHSVTLGVAALDLGGLSERIPGRFVELAIALSIAYVAVENLLRREPRNPWLEAFVFGLIHGLGFAGFLGDALRGESLVTTALVGFNLGVEVGQIGVVLALTALFALFRRGSAKPARVDDERAARRLLVPDWFRVVASVGVACLGFYWFLERAGWLPFGA